MYADDRWHELDLHGLVKHLANSGRLVGLRKLITDFRGVDDLISYPMAGSFAKYVYESHGRNALLAVWEGGSSVVPRVLNRSWPEIEQDWLRVVMATTAVVASYP
ncbi:MAG: hypothetical protein ACREMA_07680, partial [Longimicrobiales bacterium]